MDSKGGQQKMASGSNVQRLNSNTSQGGRSAAQSLASQMMKGSSKATSKAAQLLAAQNVKS